ncbi:hypothetical protein K437DRAFT_241804 [Tilletiaria anomala UBC 951]|uniref:Uncharacterized protein n=1 Tax=Tilletiaria anomala (strain ATCC 24038 / CBS 436.72 / UBC 951) TaxID=1037660 RepID=A0A066WRG6_TILAU|nr:uncharacterized protein K437DRAFT_241804 [Tilletiaria anomala UBC 951]KDN53599.1 hypothetical protein K437DRAFT_241804 [Tilletiaria anomala UBC 951]
MSQVALATSQISESPDKNAVTKAVDPKQKAADVDRKMRFYGVLQAFREGRYPDNEQIDNALRYTIQQSPIDVSKLSPDGQRLIADVREIIETARQMVLQKNSHEEFQKFLFASRKADVTDRVGVKAPVAKEDAQNDAETAGKALRSLIKLFLRNGELRKLFNDFALIGRDVFADAASKAADIARPEEEKLAKVDHPAPDNHFHEDIPQTFKKVKKLPEAADKAKEDGTEAADKATDLNAPVKENVNNILGAVKASTLDKIPENRKQVIEEHTEKTKNYVKEKFPKARRDQFIYRLKKVVVECQRHHEYQDAMEFFLTAFEHYTGHAKSIAAQVESSATNARAEGNVQTAEATFRTLIERFANGKSTQPMVDAIDQIYTDVRNDPELKDWFSKLDKFLRSCLQLPGFIMKDEANTQARQLVESGKKFFVAADGREQGKYVAHKDRLFDEIQSFFLAMGNDPLNKKFGEDWKRLTQDLFLDAEGKATFKSHLWKDVRDPILPELMSHIGLIPIPRIEYSDEAVDVVIENLTLDAANLLPNIVEIDARNYFKMSRFNKLGDVHRHSFKITLSQIQTDMRDIHFAIRKKSGFPKMKDQGVADILVGGKGLTVTVLLEASSVPKGKQRRHVFTVKQVKANVHRMDFAIRHSKHDLLIKIFKPLASSLIKKQIKNAIERGITEGLEKADVELVDLFNQLDASKQDPETSAVDVAKQKVGSDDALTKKKGTFKLATSKRNSILPNMGDKSGWVNRIDERSDAAKAEQAGRPDWHSPAFSIVSSNQPEPKNVGNLPTSGRVSSKPNGNLSNSTNGVVTSGPETGFSIAAGN